MGGHTYANNTYLYVYLYMLACSCVAARTHAIDWSIANQCAYAWSIAMHDHTPNVIIILCSSQLVPMCLRCQRLGTPTMVLPWPLAA